MLGNEEVVTIVILSKYECLYKIVPRMLCRKWKVTVFHGLIPELYKDDW